MSFITPLDFKPHPYYFSYRKRFFDLSISFLLFPVLFLPFVIIAISIKIYSKGPIFFRQQRVGKDGHIFTIYKFRTMYHGAEKDQKKYCQLNVSPFPTYKIPNDPRFVGIGRFLSHTGLDELPQLFNIVKGDMSLIGPRPLPTYEYQKLPDKWLFRNLVKPGLISGWAISDRTRMTLTKWVELDVNDLVKGGILSDTDILYKALRNGFNNYWTDS